MSNDEIRAVRIARQSQMERSVEYWQMLGKTPTVEDLVLTSHILHKYIIDGWSGDMSDMLKKLDKYIADNY